MADQVSIQEIADAMYKLVAEAQGLKKLKPMDLTKTILEMYGDRADKSLCKQAIRELIESGRCIYTYFGGSYVELTPKQGDAPPA